MPIKTQQFANRYGLEVSDGVVWQGWEPGGEYTKNITLRNVDIKTKKLKYRLPCSRFFTTKYPQEIILSSGTTVNLPVTFRPLDQNVYEEKILFETKNGKFSVPIKAILPEVDLHIPETVDFGPCAVGDQMQKSFEIINNCNLEVSFNLSSSNLFQLTPSSGVLGPKSRCSILAQFKPKAAHVYEVAAVCEFTTSSSKPCLKKLSLLGIGKFAHLGVHYKNQQGRTVDIDFGSIALQTIAERTLELVNYSPVNAPFQVLQPSFDASIDKVFKCSLYHGVVPANGTMKITISYAPNFRDVKHADCFEILALGSTTCAVIRCAGKGIGPNLALDASSISFGRANANQEVTRAFQIINQSQVDAFYQFLIDCNNSVFHFESKCGSLKKNSSRTIKVTFTPEKPINYYRKVVCLVHNQDPIYLDLFGTCHTDQVAPAVMNRKHLDRYKLHVKRGLSRIPPEDLTAWLNEGKIKPDEDDNSLEIQDETLNYDLEKSNVDFNPMEEHFLSGSIEEMTSGNPHVSIDLHQVEFSRCTHGQAYHKTINLTNHTQGKVTCVWNSGMKGSSFIVSPMEMDILPLKSASFSIRFKPTVQGQFFAAELEGYVFFKNTRDHRLYDEITFCPPWCVTVNVSGHTFAHKNETFLPEYQLDLSNLVFPPTVCHQPRYKTVLLTNTGKNPIDFDLVPENDRIVTCKPSRGLLDDKYQIWAFRFTPEFDGTFNSTIKCKLNASEKFCKEIQIIGSAEVPDLQIQPKEVVYFKQTCVGTTSTVKVSVKNPCRIPLRYQWQIPAEDKDLLSVNPTSGMISANELQDHEWSFKPNSKSKYLFKVKLRVWIDGHRELQKKKLLRFVGEGDTGSLKCYLNVVDFGDVVVGSSKQREIQLNNQSYCGLYFDLFVDYQLEEDNQPEFDVELSKSSGYIPARSQMPVRVKVMPEVRNNHQCQIMCRLLPTRDDNAENSVESLCSVLVKGVYPSLAVKDIRASGCAEKYSIMRLWELFSIDRLNMYLDADPAAEELKYAAVTRHSTRRRMPVHTRAIIDFNFGSAPYLSEPCQVSIYLQNTGSAPAEWAFLLPTDLQLELEFWAQTGDFDEDELHEMFVMDNNLFNIEPKKGILSSGESQVVTLMYRHSSAGIHKLPVLLKVAKGREILLNFTGNTVSPDERYLHFSTTRHMFVPLPIGNITPPIQTYPLYNDGGQPLQFQMDLQALDEIQQENCGWRVFECLNSSGEIAPGETAFISWIFSPLEAKTYTVDVLIHVVGGGSTFVTFTGIGYDPQVMGPTMMFSDQSNDSLPKKQLIEMAEQMMYLSEERISFGNIPVLTASRRIIFLRNASQYALSFRWLLERFPACDVVSISPSQGYIQPSDCIMCKVTFRSNGSPAIYDIDCICEVTNETLMSAYNKKLVAWHNKQKEKKMLFTLTEADVEQQNAIKRPGSGSRKLNSLSKSSKVHRSESDLQKYEALPPIGSDKKNQNNAMEDEDVQPEPPDSYTVHLGITARTYMIQEYYSNFPDDAEMFFIHSNASSMIKLDEKETRERQDCTNEEFEMISSILPVILKDLLGDRDFERSIRKVQEEPIPYFGMLSSEDAGSRLHQHETAVADSEAVSEAGLGDSVEDALREVIEEYTAGGEQSTSEEYEESEAVENIDASGIISRGKVNDVVERNQSFERKEDQRIDPAIKERQLLKSSTEARDIFHEIFENTIFNLLSEAHCGEISLTARPRLIALPPSAKGNHQKKSDSAK
eukprot:gene17503-19253_t